MPSARTRHGPPRRRAGLPDLARPLAIVAAIAAWTLLVNLPTFARQDADDAFFLEVARLWTEGLPPYVAAYDVKGPAGFAFLAAAVALLGPTLSTLKIVAIAASSVAGTALYRIARPRDRAAAIACVALYPIFMVVCGDVVYQTINATLLVAFALAFGEPVGRGRAAAAGLAIGLACAIKQTCVIDALAIAYVLWAKAGPRAIGCGVLAAFAAATPLVPAGFFLYYVWLGAGGRLHRRRRRRRLAARRGCFARRRVVFMGGLPLPGVGRADCRRGGVDAAGRAWGTVCSARHRRLAWN